MMRELRMFFLEISKDSLFRMVVYFFSLAFLLSPFSYYLSDSAEGALKYLFYFLVFIGSLFSLFLFSKAKLGFGRIVSLVFFSLTILSFVFSCHALYQYFSGCEQLAKWDDPNYLSNQTRVYSIFANPNLFAGFLLMVIPMNIALLFSRVNKFWLSVFALGTLANLSVLFLTGSRAAILSFLILAFSVFVTLRPKPLVILAFLLVLTVVFVINPSILLRLQSVFLWDAYSSNEYRIQVWLSSLDILRENWIIGIGLGNDVFRKVYALYMKPGFEALSAYSIYLEILIETGALGLILFLAVLTKSIKSLLYTLRRDRVISLVLLACIFGFMLHGLFDTVFFRPMIQSVFWFLIAVVIMLKRQYLREGVNS